MFGVLEHAMKLLLQSQYFIITYKSMCVVVYFVGDEGTPGCSAHLELSL